MGEEVDPSDPTVQAVARKMVEIMLEFNGVGLAAPQVGLAWRLFVTRDPDNEEGGIAWINPVIEDRLIFVFLDTIFRGTTPPKKVMGSCRVYGNMKMTILMGFLLLIKCRRWTNW